MWIFFNEPEKEPPAPRFCLPPVEKWPPDRLQAAELRCVDEFAGDGSLVLAFFPHLAHESHRAALGALARHGDSFRRAEGQAVAVVGTVDGAGEWAAQLPLPVLVDPLGEVRAAYAGLMAAHLTAPGDVLLFVLDRYLVPYTAYIDARLDPDELLSGLISWLDFIGMQCPE